MVFENYRTGREVGKEMIYVRGEPRDRFSFSLVRAENEADILRASSCSTQGQTPVARDR
jgi:hypothetical protein